MLERGKDEKAFNCGRWNFSDTITYRYFFICISTCAMASWNFGCEYMVSG